MIDRSLRRTLIVLGGTTLGGIAAISACSHNGSLLYLCAKLALPFAIAARTFWR